MEHMFTPTPYTWARMWKYLVIYRMRVVPFGVSSSPFLLCAAVRKQGEIHEAKNPQEAEALEKGIYVDDLITGDNTVENAYVHCEKILAILAEVRMPLVKWATSNEELHDRFLQNKFHLRQEKYEDHTLTKLLGIFWSVQEDEIRFEAPEWSEVPETKRELLSVVAAVFDPLGILSPVLLSMKLLLQSLWAKSKHWDEKMTEEQQQQVEIWKQDMQQIRKMKIPRWVETLMQTEINLEAYCDASMVAYGCVLYVVGEKRNKNLLMAKSRVAPMTKLTLPRLELTAAVLAARLVAYVKAHLPRGFAVGSTKYFSDSMVTLAWIRSEKNQWRAYVSNRVEEILRSSESAEWHYISTKINPADILTRPVSCGELLQDERWWKGVHPVLEEVSDVVPFPEEERKKLNVVFAGPLEINYLEKKIKGFSSWSKLVRVFGYILKWRNKSYGEEFTPPELAIVEIRLMKFSQSLYYAQGLETLKKDPTGQKTVIKEGLELFLGKQGQLRIRSRLSKAPLTFDERYPVLLHPDSWLTILFLRHIHETLIHAEVGETLYRVRDKYWVQRARRVIKSVVRNCSVCRYSKLKKNDPSVGDLPLDRVTPAALFQNTGLDHMGPVYVGAPKEKLKKTYILLFTCLVTRAIHLEVSLDLTVASFLLAFRRFGARYGVPAKVYSDNSKTFVRGAQEITSWGAFIAHEEIKTLLM